MRPQIWIVELLATALAAISLAWCLRRISDMVLDAFEREYLQDD